MEEFTMRNFFKQWKALLPLAIIFVFVGLIGGIFYNSLQKQNYSATNEILVINAGESVMPEDLMSIANSKELVGNSAIENANVDKTCAYKANKSGNVIKITSTCESNGEDAKKLSNSVVDVFSGAIMSVYNNSELAVKTITHAEAEERITSLNRILYVIIPVLAGLALSAFVAFVKLDHETSKKHK